MPVAVYREKQHDDRISFPKDSSHKSPFYTILASFPGLARFAQHLGDFKLANTPAACNEYSNTLDVSTYQDGLSSVTNDTDTAKDVTTIVRLPSHAKTSPWVHADEFYACTNVGSPKQFPPRVLWGTCDDWYYEVELPRMLDASNPLGHPTIAIRARASIARLYNQAPCQVECCLTETTHLEHARTSQILWAAKMIDKSPSQSWVDLCQLPVDIGALAEPHSSISTSWVQIKHEFTVKLTLPGCSKSNLDASLIVLQSPVTISSHPMVQSTPKSLHCHDNCDNKSTNSQDSGVCMTCTVSTSGCSTSIT